MMFRELFDENTKEKVFNDDGATVHKCKFLMNLLLENQQQK